MNRPSYLLLAALAGLAGAPPVTAAYRPDLAALASVPRQSVPPAVVKNLIERAPTKDAPYRFAVAVDVPLAKAGQWTVEGDTAVWRARLHSAGARTLSASFPQARLPPGAVLRTYDPSARLVHGPFRRAQLTRTGLWTPLVRGEELVIEARMPRAQAGEFSLGTAKAYHGYRGWKTHEPGHEPGEAGSCNIDITCSTDWLADAGSVARIIIGNLYACTGQLVNNVEQDERRLFLTAAHCGIGAVDEPPESVTFYFNYVGPCGNNQTDPEPEPAWQGSSVLAEDPVADFTLLLVTSEALPPAGAYFAGWDATGAGAGSGASIHHPHADEKKIALFTAPVSASSVAIEGHSCKIDAWQVQWSSGTTEVGSSGAGLWNADHRIIGVLSGGGADCTTPQAPDYYGRLERGWFKLKEHLDPLTTCIASIPGHALGTVATALPSDSPKRCEGEATVCTSPGGIGRPSGGSAGSLAAGLLLGALLRRRRR